MGNLKTHALDTKKNRQKKKKTENEKHGPHTNTGAEININQVESAVC